MQKTASLTPQEVKVVLHGGTEPPNIGQYAEHFADGSYVCRLCGLALYRSHSKFVSCCGWPSYDACIEGAVRELPDADGRRTEMRCSSCDAHLGHVFRGEGLTPRNTRYCINSLALDFVDSEVLDQAEELILAAGCFWGVQKLLNAIDGVHASWVGYSGGDLAEPTYELVCGGGSGHVEAVRLLYDPGVVSALDILKYFFEIHDYTDQKGQMPDVGSQYMSVIFYNYEAMKAQALGLIEHLSSAGNHVATKLMPYTVFWPAEAYHQNYLVTNPLGYCSHSHNAIDW